MAGIVMRVSPAGVAEQFIDLTAVTGGGYSLTAANFGSDVGEWKRDHLYLSSLNGGVYELEVGIPGRVEPHLRQQPSR